MGKTGRGSEKYEFLLGMKELALIFSGSFLVIVLVFTLGIMVGKELYGVGETEVGSKTSDVVTKKVEPRLEKAPEPPPEKSPELDFMKELKSKTPEEPPTKPEVKAGTEPEEKIELPPMPDGKWTIQVAASTNLKEAEKLAEKLAGLGYPARVDKFVKGGKTWSRVRIGWFKSEEKALDYLNNIKAKGIVPTDSFVAPR